MGSVPGKTLTTPTGPDVSAAELGGSQVSSAAQPGPAPTPPEPAQKTPEPRDSETERWLREARKAYKGPFLLASDLFSELSPVPAAPAANVSDDYRLGPGDEMVLFVFGSAVLECPLKVDLAGGVTIPKVGSAQVAGLRLGDARRVVGKLLNRSYGGSRVELLFTKTRTVRIFLLGEVYRPGSHPVPSLTSILDALSVAGGPTPTGSYRSIQLLRNGQRVATQDLYALRLQGRGMENLSLQDGDTLFVPPVGKQVLMMGPFVRLASLPVSKDAPGVLVELLPGETAWEAIGLLDGLLPEAYPEMITLEQTGPDGVARVENLAMDAKGLRAHALGAKDILRALPRSGRREGLVEVHGYARVPGSFAYRPGLKVSELLGNPQQLQPDTFMGRAEVLRTKADGSTQMLAFELGKALQKLASQDLVLEPRDRIRLFQVGALRPKQTVTILGPFSSPGTYPWHERMRVADLVFQAGVPLPQADRTYAELAHTGPGGTLSEVRRLDLGSLLYSPDGPAPALEDEARNPLLRPFDQVTLYELPDFRQHRTVTITGQVGRPGPYVITEPHFTLKQLVERAGGLRPEAMVKGAVFLRNSMEDKQLRMADVEKAGIQGPDPTAHGVKEILERLSETRRSKNTDALLESPVMHGLIAQTANRLVVDFDAALHGDSRRDVELLDGDQIVIPRQAQSAYVVGEVASPFTSFRVQKGDRVRDLVRMAGGFTRNADEGELRLLKADGRILDQAVLRQEIEPGDAVLIPQRFRLNVTWHDNLAALTPLALIANAIRR